MTVNYAGIPGTSILNANTIYVITPSNYPNPNTKDIVMSNCSAIIGSGDSKDMIFQPRTYGTDPSCNDITCNAIAR